jgi:hypothetical protein
MRLRDAGGPRGHLAQRIWDGSAYPGGSRESLTKMAVGLKKKQTPLTVTPEEKAILLAFSFGK